MAAADPDFGLRQVLTVGPIQSGNVVVRVSTKGQAPATITAKGNWVVQMTEAASEKRSIAVRPDVDPIFDPFDPAKKRGTNVVTITLSSSRFSGFDLDGASWSVVFSDGKYLLPASQVDSESGLKAAKARDDADLYLAGSYLAGFGTKPIWVVDAKGGYSEQWSKILILGKIIPISSPNVRAGVSGDIQTNVDAKAPVDRTRVDPDSISALAKISGDHRIGHRVYSLAWEADLAGGEFSRSNPSSNFISGGKAQVVTQFFGNLPIDLNPIVGFELGKNLNKPSTLFDRPVDLTGYDAIERLLVGADSHYYAFRRKITDPDDPYLLTFSASWIARIPRSPEPFTKLEFVSDDKGSTTRQKVVSLRQNTRHFLKADLNWNVTKLLGVQVEYKYGSLPPLFQFVDHQVTVGFVFKARFAKWH